MHIFLDLNANGTGESSEEVLETRLGQLIAGDATREVTRLDLNRSFIDSDGDGLPDDWERFYFGNLGSSPSTPSNGAGVSNLLSLAMGLDPTRQNSHLLPFLRLDSSAGLAYYFRSSAAFTGTSVRVMSCDKLLGPWAQVPGNPVEIGTWEGSTLFRLDIPEDIDRRKRFFRLEAISTPPPP